MHPPLPKLQVGDTAGVLSSTTKRGALRDALSRWPAAERARAVRSEGDFFLQRTSPPSFEACAQCRFERGAVLWANPWRPGERWRQIVVQTDEHAVDQFVAATNHAIKAMAACLDDVKWSGPLEPISQPQTEEASGLRGLDRRAAADVASY